MSGIGSGYYYNYKIKAYTMMVVKERPDKSIWHDEKVN